MFSIIGITGRVGGGAASRLLELGKQVRAVVRDEAKGQVWASNLDCPMAVQQGLPNRNGIITQRSAVQIHPPQP